jgi:ABC-type antimicrobial peptide transport system permease subunit
VFSIIIENKIYLILANWNSSKAGNFLRQPENTTIFEGKRLLLKCKPNLNQFFHTFTQRQQQLNLINYQWFKNDKEIDFTSKMVSITKLKKLALYFIINFCFIA